MCVFYSGSHIGCCCRVHVRYVSVCLFGEADIGEVRVGFVFLVMVSMGADDLFMLVARLHVSGYELVL